MIKNTKLIDNEFQLDWNFIKWKIERKYKLEKWLFFDRTLR